MNYSKQNTSEMTSCVGTEPPRSLYSLEELQPILEPRSVVIIGASARTSSFGYRTLENLQKSDIPFFCVNPNGVPINGRSVFKSVAELPERPDCAVIAVPRDAVESAVLACAQVGIKGALIYASGYAETGLPHHAELQKRLTSISRESGIRILGPNCVGILSGKRNVQLTFADAPQIVCAPITSIGLVSQSGGLGFALAQASVHGYSFSHVLTAGNSCDVDIADQIAFLVDQPQCAVIACLFEGMPDPARMMAAGAKAWRAGKPVIIHKIAVGKEGIEAAKSHTGSMAGSANVYSAAFERCGFVEVSDFEALVETAAFFAKAGRPMSEGVAVLATSGGAAIMVADKAELHDVALPQPDEEISAVLRSHIPEFGSTRNPCDMTAQILNDPKAIFACAYAFLKCDKYSALIIPHPYAYETGTTRLEALAEVGHACRKPVCCVWLSQWLDGPGAQAVERNPNLMLFRSVDRCIKALKAWHLRERHREITKLPTKRLCGEEAKKTVERILARAESSIVTEGDAKRALAAYGVPVVAEVLVHDADTAARAAIEIGFPVVLKVESPDIPHKTEAGGVQLNLNSESEVRNAFGEILSSVTRDLPSAQILGFLVQPMISRDVELIIGAKRDPLFGPVLVAGFGGVAVELINDTSVALIPVSKVEAIKMLDRLRGRQLLDGFRGSMPIDVNEVADVISRISELVSDHRALISELDVNPLVVTKGRVVAVDALLVLSE